MIRSSCAACRFKELPRISDITIGDFWGGDYTPDERKNGVSLLMVNSQKGRCVLEAIKPRLVLRRASLDTALTGNSNINNSVKLNFAEQDIFFKKLENENFSGAVWSMLRTPVWKRYFRWYADIIRTHVKRLAGN